IGSLVGGAFSGLASAAGGIGQTVAQTAAPVVGASNPLDTLEMQIRASGNDPQAMTTAAVSAMRSLVTGRVEDADAAR
ncbi:PhnA-like protein, partial [Rhizobiaceae sp. 2RAB30]